MGQTVPDAYKDNPNFWGGLEVSNVTAGFPHDSSLRLTDLGGVVTFYWTHHFNLQGHARVVTLDKWHGESEQDYFGGPRYTFLASEKWRPFVSFEIGVVRVRYPFQLGSGVLFAMVPNAGLEYRLNHRWSVHAAYEVQFLPNSPNFSNEPKFGMRPNGPSAGISYRIF